MICFSFSVRFVLRFCFSFPLTQSFLDGFRIRFSLDASRLCSNFHIWIELCYWPYLTFLRGYTSLLPRLSGVKMGTVSLVEFCLSKQKVNLIEYNRTQSLSLWLQSKGEIQFYSWGCQKLNLSNCWGSQQFWPIRKKWKKCIVQNAFFGSLQFVGKQRNMALFWN